MRTPRPLPSLLAVASLSFATLPLGCAYGEMRQVLRAQVAAEIDCPEVTVSPTKSYQSNHKEGQYKIEGCGVIRTYTCPAEDGLVSFDDRSCTFVEGDINQPKARQVAAEPAMDEGDSMEEPEPEAKAKPKAKDDATPSKAAVKASGKLKLGK